MDSPPSPAPFWVEEKNGVWRSTKVRATPGLTLDDDVLQTAYDVVAEKPRGAGAGDPARQGAAEAAGRPARRPRDPRAPRVTDARALPAHPVARRRLPARGRGPSSARPGPGPGRGADQRTGALIALLSALGKAPKVVDHEGLPAKEVTRRAKELAEGAWAAKAVRDAINASTAAMTAATTAAVAAGVASS